MLSDESSGNSSAIQNSTSASSQKQPRILEPAMHPASNLSQTAEITVDS
jgi:hypothetical protein